MHADHQGELRPNGGWTTGYADDIPQVLAAEQFGTLTRVERAVLALILLRTVAIPRAQGLHQHDGWAGGEHSVTLEELVRNRHLSRAAITGALRGLRAVGYVAMTASGGYIPGPALARLGAVDREALWEDLLLLARPHGYMAERIRVRRNETRALLSQPLADTVGGRG